MTRRRLRQLPSCVSFAFVSWAFCASVCGQSTLTPDWAKDTIWYQIFPERFANGDRRNDPTRDSLTHPEHVPDNWQIMDWDTDWMARAQWEQTMSHDMNVTVHHRRYGGDLSGIVEKLDYLKTLGINGIYLNPVFHADSLHKYDGNSFHHIDPFFGPDPSGDLELMKVETSDPATWKTTAADRYFLWFLQEAKKKGIRVIIDGVWNHTGCDFFAFRDILQAQQDSVYGAWYSVLAYDNPETDSYEFDYQGWYGFKSLPEFSDNAAGTNLASGPKQYIFNATRRWMDPNGDGDPSDGIDGWRLDVAEQVPTGFWREWHGLVRSINPEAYTTAEIWGSSAEFIAANHFSAAMNYRGFAIPVKGWLVDGRISATEFARRLEEDLSKHPFDQALILQNLVDSHDTQRVASAIANRGTYEHYKSADWFDYDEGERVNMQSQGYNTEAPDDDGRRIWKMLALFQATFPGAPMIYYGTELGMWGADDPHDRMPSNWSNPDRDIYNSYQAALALRKEFEILRRGEFRIVETNDDKQLFVFERRLGGSYLIIAFNRSNDDIRIEGSYLRGMKLQYNTAGRDQFRNVPRLSASVYIQD